MKARVTIMPKSGVLDPQGKAIEGALASLGFDGVAGVRQGKIIDLELGTGASREQVEEMCKKLLANPVMENFTIEIAE